MSVNLLKGTSDFYPVQYIKQNNLGAFRKNAFKKPTTTKYYYTLTAGGLQFYPTDQTSELQIVVIKTPRVLSLSPVVNPELDDNALYNILLIALKIGGIAIRDEELQMDIRNTGLANAQ
jgi:hypothetical protein